MVEFYESSTYFRFSKHKFLSCDRMQYTKECVLQYLAAYPLSIKKRICGLKRLLFSKL
jgi:hypothetical protein